MNTSIYVDGFTMMFPQGTTLRSATLRQAVAEVGARFPEFNHCAVIGTRRRRPSGATVVEVSALRMDSDTTRSSEWLRWNSDHEVKFMAQIRHLDEPWRQGMAKLTGSRELRVVS